MNTKKCPECASVHVIKKGFQKGIQKWKCINCSTYFQANTKALPSPEELFRYCVFYKQTITELAQRYGIRRSTVQHLYDAYILPEKIHTPREIFLVVDATYFGHHESGSSFCLVLFRDAYTQEDIWWTFCSLETTGVYREGREYLESLGYIIRGITADGLPLIRKAFFGIPFQLCLVHMERIIVRGTTRTPVLEAGQVLLALGRSLHTTQEHILKERIRLYAARYTEFLNERAHNTRTGEWWYVHAELRRAYLSLCTLFPFLFTYMHYPLLTKTSNSIEGHFAHIKEKVSLHRGMSRNRKQKLITALLLNSSAALKDTKEHTQQSL